MIPIEEWIFELLHFSMFMVNFLLVALVAKKILPDANDINVAVSCMLPTFVLTTCFLEIIKMCNVRTITEYITALNGEWGYISFGVAIASAIMQNFGTEGPWETKSLCFLMFVVANLSFLVIYARQDVCTDVCKSMIKQSAANFVVSLLKQDVIGMLTYALSAGAYYTVMRNGWHELYRRIWYLRVW